MGRKRKKKTQKRIGINIDLAIIILLVLSVLLFILIYGETGAIGEVLSPTLGGIIGFIKYIIPIGTIGIAFSLAKGDNDYLISKLIQYTVFLACFASILSIYQISKGTLNIDGEFKDTLSIAYSLGEKNIGGGVVGTTIAFPLIQLLGMFGAAIASIGIAAVLLIFTFGIQPSEIILSIMDTLDERKSERAELYNELAEERHNRRKQANLEKVSKQGAKHDEKQTHEAFDEDQITINLNNQANQNNGDEEKEDKKPKFNIFGILDKVGDKDNNSNEPEEMNPNEINDYFVQEEEIKEDKTKQVLNLQHNATIIEDENYEFPPVELLKQGTTKSNRSSKKSLTDTATKLQRTLYSFGVSAKVENVTVGPAITRYVLKPAEGVRVSKIAKLL